MPRPKRNRKIGHPPSVAGFKPMGIPLKDLEPVELLYEEYESIRLCDYEGYDQTDAAKLMDVSRPTFTRIYEKARRNIALALSEGKAIIIEGGNIKADTFWYKCQKCQRITTSTNPDPHCHACESTDIKLIHEPDQSEESTPEDRCICLHCNHEEEHQKGIPCRKHICPGCGNKMIKKGSYHHQRFLNQGKK